MKDLFQRIFLSTDPENEVLKELVYDYLPVVYVVTHGGILTEFAPEWAGSYLQKPSGNCSFSALHLFNVRISGEGLRDILLFKQPNKRPSKFVSTLTRTSNSWSWQKMVYLISTIFLTLQIRTRH